MTTCRLRNLKFKSLSVYVLSIEHFPRIRVIWDLEKTSQDLRYLKFFVDRGESADSLQQISGAIAHDALREYVDETPILSDNTKTYYYRVRAVEFLGETPVQTFYSEPSTWEGNLDLVGLYVVEEHLFALRYVYGVPAFIYKKIRDGAYCPNCFDPILKRVTKSNCKVCFGTGMLGGYYPAIPVWMSFEPDPKITQVAEFGLRDVSQTDVQFVNYPLLSPDDVILEVKQGKFWKVSSVRYPQKNRTTMLQFLRLNQIDRSDVEYSINIPDEARRKMVKELEERELEREF